MSFRYIPRVEAPVSYVMVCGASNKNLENAVITFPEMEADGETQVVKPQVAYEGKILTQNLDYVILGDSDYTDAGVYTCYIRGIYSYTGLVTCTYTVTGNGVGISGQVTTGAEGVTTVELSTEDQVIATAAVSGKTGAYTLENVAAGTYTMTVSKQNHVTRSYTVTVAAAAVVQDVKIHLIGDIDGNGKVNVGDVAKINSHVKGTNLLTDEYQILCANVNGGKLNIGDTAALYGHIKGTKKLY